MNYIIREIPDELWRKVKSKCALEGISIKSLIITLLKTWVERE